MDGLSLNLPLQLAARDGTVGAARAQLARTQAELAGVEDTIRGEVERARLRLVETEHVLRVYRERLLPTARARIEAVRIGYQTGRSDLQHVIDAERSLRTLQLQHQEALATFGQRRAELSYALGRPPGGAFAPERGRTR
jgi:outer membrane protein TolC